MPALVFLGFSMTASVGGPTQKKLRDLKLKESQPMQTQEEVTSVT